MKDEDTTLEQENEEDRHVVCPSYPNCDENPLGCILLQKDEVEMFGHK